MRLSYYQPAAVSNTFNADFGGKYQLGVDLMVNESFVDNVFDYNKCRLIFRVGRRKDCSRQITVGKAASHIITI